jgi:hypothetical protein
MDQKKSTYRALEKERRQRTVWPIGTMNRKNDGNIIKWP